MVTYYYTDGIAALDACVSVTGENGWAVPPSMESWTYGQPAPQPVARPAFGSVEFFYGPSPEGPFQSELPTIAGTWYVLAKVEGTPSTRGWRR